MRRARFFQHSDFESQLLEDVGTFSVRHILILSPQVEGTYKKNAKCYYNRAFTFTSYHDINMAG